MGWLHVANKQHLELTGFGACRNRGTEYVKSPEMLLVGNAQRADRHGFDRRRREGAGPPADVWALGCLLYELLTGDFLFYDPDWIRFFVRLAQPGQVCLPPSALPLLVCQRLVPSEADSRLGLVQAKET